MFKKSNGKKNLVGVDIGSSSIKAVELQKKGNAYHLVNLGFESVWNVLALPSGIAPLSPP